MPSAGQLSIKMFGGVRVAQDEIHQRRAVAGSGKVTQEDVDLAARVLISVRERPYP